MSDQVSLSTIQRQSLILASGFLGRAKQMDVPKEAADWSLAAKNALNVATDCERIIELRQRVRR